ncbi:hypothetical protein LSCM1_03322 [Leishmania martiniquensis]|uniref:Uncharacterized protein n=1 Tax=Leishmania martiniquensis TaxID=1580590 RepID=A0A836HCV0_9TRYP|nr:hypothetical protein LSCM1_03322 [Leishmania martiniquensis]
MNPPRLPQLRQPTRAKTATPSSTAVATAPAAAAACEVAVAWAASCHPPVSTSAMASSLPSVRSGAHAYTPAAPAVHTPEQAVPASRQRFCVGGVAAVFQAKLKHALWLDQLTTIAHNEARSRARTRCIESEERDALWWQHRRERERQQHTEDNAHRLEALHKAKRAPACDDVPHCCADRIEREESSDRRAIEAVAEEGHQGLCAAQHTWELQGAVMELARQQQDAQAMHHAAKQVRALELELAAHSYRALRALTLAVDDLLDIADGIWPSASAPPALTVSPSPPLSAAHEAPCEAKIREMYARRALLFDEAKERLLLDWWQGAAQLRYVEAPGAWQTFSLWSYYVRSPVCMHALVTVQRWWRMQRVAPWSQHRRASLARSLARLPGHYSVERCQRHLRSLQRTASREKDKGTCTADGVSAALAVLVIAATSSRRYRTLLSLYTYTVAQRAHAVLESQPNHSAAVVSTMRASLLSPCTRNGYLLPYDNWRQQRWAPYSKAHRRSVSTVERVEKSHRQCLSDREAEHRHRAALFGSILHCGRMAVLELQDRQAALAQEERTSRLRVTRQETHEYHVLRATVAAALPTPSRAALSPKRRGTVFAEGRCVEESAAAEMRTSVATHSLGGQGANHARGVAAASFRAEHDAWAQAQRCVQFAHHVLAMTQQQSAQVRLGQRGASAETETASASPEDAAALYRAALDKAAAAVRCSEYAALRERYVARNAHALKQMRESFKMGLRERAAIIAEEAQELKRICHCDASAQRVSHYQLEERESDSRAALERTQGRAAADLYDAFFNSLCFIQWGLEAREKNERAHCAAARPWARPLLELPSLSPVERLASRETVCRTRLVCNYLAVLADALLQCSRSHHELQYQDWSALCHTIGARLDSAASSNLPLAQMCLLKADERDARQGIWTEAQVGARALLVDGHALYGTETMWSDYLFGHLKLTSEAYYMDTQLREYLLVRLANVGQKMGELLQMETMTRGRVEYAEAITRDLRFHLHRLRLE